jgi:serum/glucocorticoid-regulated kinase 2
MTPPEKQSGMTAAQALSGASVDKPAHEEPQEQEDNKAKAPVPFSQELQRMKEMQERQELAPDEVEEMKKADVVLLDDGLLLGIGFKSFDILEILGHGAFGKVFKCRLKGTDQEYAMKILKKAFLYRNKHLKYAITECNILKQASHPYVIKMHYSF